MLMCLYHLILVDTSCIRRSKCDCTKELYYKLKKSTRRMSLCQNPKCFVVKDIRYMMECSNCKTIQYCSKECAMAHYSEHKEFCRHLNTNLNDEAECAGKGIEGFNIYTWDENAL